MLHLSIKYLEFALLRGPVHDPYTARGRSRIVSALDICINSRLVGLSSTEVGSVRSTELDKDGIPLPRPQRHLPPAKTPPSRTRSTALGRHALRLVLHYLVLDTLMALIRHFGSSTIANPAGVPSALETFSHSDTFVILPHIYPIRPYSSVVEIVVTVSVAVGVWQGLSLGYHAFALSAIGTGLWEWQAWEVDLFEQPWKADSILDLWGKRWHQMFRNQFLLLTNLVLALFHLPRKPTFQLPLVFSFSAVYHILGQISMSPVPATIPLGLFFIVSGVGCSLEYLFKGITGRRVRGPWGRVWTWCWMVFTGRWAVAAWLDGGIGGGWLLPIGGPGEWLKHVVIWFVDLK
ncbi:hypothetical protein P7C73_g4480, partial [Tremellales sp. Uapishka_1]